MAMDVLSSAQILMLVRVETDVHADTYVGEGVGNSDSDALSDAYDSAEIGESGDEI
ncbi:hypothetical protein HAX54_015670, partial [Datura stramonium]|nr:hypothetical protein [Datura stramonium]